MPEPVAQPLRGRICDSAPVMSIEEIVVLTPAQTADAAWAIVHKLAAYADEQYGQPDVQELIRATLRKHVTCWSDLTSQIEAVFTSRGIVLVRGLRFDSENRVLVGLIASLGRPVGDGNPAGRLVYDLYPIERRAGELDFELYFHTGSPAQERPHEILALLCVKQGDRGGGVSRLAPVEPALECMRRQNQSAAVKMLCERPYPFKSARRGREAVYHAPIVEHGQVRFQRDLIFNGAAALPASFDEGMSAAIGAFEAALNIQGSYLEYPLQDSELLIVDNRRVLHARTAIVGGRESGRHLKRVKAYRP